MRKSCTQLVLEYRDEPNKTIKNVYFADNFLSRLRGLMGKGKLKPEECLIITPCNSIHTFFMKFSIDVLFINGGMRVVKVYRNLRPWKVTKIIKDAKTVIELPAGTVKGNVERVHMVSTRKRKG